MNLLSLDISTTRIGWSVFYKQEIQEVGYIDLSKIKKGPYEKLDFAIEALDKLVARHNVTDMVAEAALQKFSFGKSSASVLNLLMSFNFALSYAVRNMGVKVSHVSFAHARKLTGISFIKHSNSAEKKELIRQYCEKKYPALIWEKKKTGTYKDGAYDISDAIIIGEARLQSSLQDKDNQASVSKCSRKSSS